MIPTPRLRKGAGQPFTTMDPEIVETICNTLLGIALLVVTAYMLTR